MNSMSNEIEVAKNIFLLHLKDDKSIDWNAIVLGFTVFEIDPKPLYTEIYKLELDGPEEIMIKLPDLHQLFIEELAEAYVLDKSSVTNKELLESTLFNENINFFKALKNAISKQERKRIIQELPKMSDRLDFNLSDNEIKSAIKKKARIELKDKFDKWDKELVFENENQVIFETKIPQLKQREGNSTPDFSIEDKTKGKVISLSWIKYAVAAIIVLGFFIWQPTQSTNVELFAYYTKNINSLTLDNNILEEESKILEANERGGDYTFKDYSKIESEYIFEALNAFRQGNYDKTKKVLIELNPKEDSEILLYLAISQLNTHEVDLAISNLEFLKKIKDYKYSNDVSFHLAMGYIKKNKREEAKFLLKELTKTENKFTAQSKEILKQMRWF